MLHVHLKSFLFEKHDIMYIFYITKSANVFKKLPNSMNFSQGPTSK